MKAKRNKLPLDNTTQVEAFNKNLGKGYVQASDLVGTDKLDNSISQLQWYSKTYTIQEIVDFNDAQWLGFGNYYMAPFFPAHVTSDVLRYPLLMSRIVMTNVDYGSSGRTDMNFRMGGTQHTLFNSGDRSVFNFFSNNSGDDWGTDSTTTPFRLNNEFNSDATGLTSFQFGVSKAHADAIIAAGDAGMTVTCQALFGPAETN